MPQSIIYNTVCRTARAQSGLGQTNWPIWTNFKENKFKLHALFVVVVIATGEIKPVLTPSLPKLYDKSAKC